MVARILSRDYTFLLKSSYSKAGPPTFCKKTQEIHFKNQFLVGIKSHENTLRLSAFISFSLYENLFKNQWLRCLVHESVLMLLGYSYSMPDFLIAFSQRKLQEEVMRPLHRVIWICQTKLHNRFLLPKFTQILSEKLLPPYYPLLFLFFAPIFKLIIQILCTISPL